ncbi:hypothetical protein SFA35_23175 [Pseudomonas sp. HR96]|uniref:hypothetical protein n=1 Tax=Pseudomonas sp. HR96 TaxID=1027966 RepID=UPI002A7612BC|nr:hypothetical protein [Pseudomonas sp. HR96]WPO99465.1 hypothetical protein SFA35_23175 [Pseudomonas sp. HR96]
MPGSATALLPALLLVALLSQTSLAANTPCSGHKGGVARCDGELFLCNDGSISQSKRSCPAYTGRSAVVDSQSTLPRPQPTPAASECGCSANRFCTGPRGGVYCLTPGGAKSYVRK